MPLSNPCTICSGSGVEVDTQTGETRDCRYCEGIGVFAKEQEAVQLDLFEEQP